MNSDLAQPTPPPPPMGKGTLSRQLVARVTALVALLTVVLALFTSLATYQILQREQDGRLQVAVGRLNPDGDHGPGDLTGSGLIRIDGRNGTYLLTTTLNLNHEAERQLLAVSPSATPVTIRLTAKGCIGCW